MMNSIAHVRLSFLLAGIAFPLLCLCRRVDSKDKTSDRRLVAAEGEHTTRAAASQPMEASSLPQPIDVAAVRRDYDKFLAERTGLPFEPKKYYNYGSIEKHPHFSPIATESVTLNPSVDGEPSGIEYLDVNKFLEIENSRQFVEPDEVNRNVVHTIYSESHGIKELLAALGTDMVVTRGMVPQLTEILNSTIRESKMKQASAGLLGAFAFAGGNVDIAVPLLGDMITRDREGQQRWEARPEIEAAVWALEAVGSRALPAMPQLGVALEDGYFVIREGAAKAFKHFGKSGLEFAPKLAALLKMGGVEDPPRSGGGDANKFGQVQVPAAEALLSMSPECTVAAPQLAEAVGDEYWLVSQLAGKTLQMMGEEMRDSVPILAKSLQAHMECEEDRWTSVESSIMTLAAAGNAAAPAAPVLASAMLCNASSPEFCRNYDRMPRMASAILMDIAKLRPSPLQQHVWDEIAQSLANAILHPAKGNRKKIQVNSAAVLEALGPLQSVGGSVAGKLRDALMSTSGNEYVFVSGNEHYVSVALLHALLSVEPQQAMEHVVKLLEHKDCIMRVFAANYLGRLGKEAKKAVSVLRDGVKQGLAEHKAELCRPPSLLVPMLLANGSPPMTVECSNSTVEARWRRKTEDRWRCKISDQFHSGAESSKALPDWMKPGWDGRGWYPVAANIHALGAIAENADGMKSMLMKALTWGEYRSEAWQALNALSWRR